jgi:hypothetical protein
MWKFFMDNRVSDSGVGLWFDSGELVELEGEQYIRDSHRLLIPVDSKRWHPTEQAARDAAAAQIATYIHALSAQYAKLREPASATA